MKRWGFKFCIEKAEFAILLTGPRITLSIHRLGSSQVSLALKDYFIVKRASGKRRHIMRNTTFNVGNSLNGL
jgi:hypothetical protein